MCNVDQLKTEDLYRSTSHELAHATHFQQVGASNQERARWWSYVFNYEATCIVLSSGAKTYEYPGLPYEERAGITEMWAHAVGHICKYEHRQKEIEPYLWVGHYWFAPEIILDLYDNGMTLKKISDCLTSDVVTLEDFQNRLVQNNNTYTSMIDGLFNKYFSD